MNITGEKILLIDADKDFLAVMSAAVRDCGYRVETATQGSDGIKLAREVEPDIIILAMYLPDMGGMQAFNRIKEIPALAEIPIILISGDASEELIVVGLSNGAADFIVKPVPINEIIVKIGNILELSKSKKNLQNINEKLETEKKRLLKYFSKDIVEKILKEEISAEPGGGNLSASILFFGIRDFNATVRITDPAHFATFINTIFANVMLKIKNNRGSTNKFMQDGILATFGCPTPTAEDELNCARAALDIRDYIKEYNDSRPEYLSAPVKPGIGIATGVVFAGNIGSLRRMEYTVMGDPVNIAARLRDLADKTNRDILIDENMYDKIADVLIAEKIENESVRGRTGRIKIFALEDVTA